MTEAEPVLTGAEPLSGALVARALAREAKVLSKMSTEAVPLDHLVPLVYDDVNPALHPVARYSLHAHLIKLREEGKVQECEKGWKI